MPEYPASGFLTNASRTESEYQQGIEDWLARTKQLPGAQNLQSLSVAPVTPSTISPSRSQVKPFPTSGTEVVINGMSSINLGTGLDANVGFIVTLYSGDSGDTVEIQTQQGGPFPNPEDILFLSTGIKMRLIDPTDNITFFQTVNGWFEISRSVAPKSALLALDSPSGVPVSFSSLAWDKVVYDPAGLADLGNNRFEIPDWVPAVRATVNILLDADGADVPFTSALTAEIANTDGGDGVYYASRTFTDPSAGDAKYAVTLQTPVMRNLGNNTQIRVDVTHSESDPLELNVKSNFMLEVIE